MPKVRVAIAQGFYTEESKPIAAQECVNFYPHIPQAQTITDAALIGVSGIKQAVTAGISTDVNRGAHVMLGVDYVVNGSNLYSITYTTDLAGVRTYVATQVNGATLISGSGRVSISNNGYQMCIVAPDVATKFNAWIYTVDGGLVAISDADFDGPVGGVSFSDGYFNFWKTTGNKFFVSNLRDGLLYTATDYATSQADPNPVVCAFPAMGNIFVFGSQSMETYQNIGNAGFPYQQVIGQTYNKGCFAAQSVAEVDGAVVFIGGGVNESPAIWVTNGSQPIKLSTPPVDNLLFSGGITPIASAFVMKWAERGHSFISWTVPTVCTVVYDMTTKLWHTRESQNSTGGIIPWLPTTIVSAYSVLLVGDSISNKIGILDPATYYEYGKEILGRFSTVAIDNEGMPFSVNSIELEMQTGTVSLTGQGSDPIISMSVSRDFGYTFLPKIERKFGKTGEYAQRVLWARLGRYNQSVIFRFSTSEPIKRVIVKAIADISG